MIQSNDNARIVEYTYVDSGNKCEGVSLIHCNAGEESSYLKATENMPRLEVTKIRKVV
jgi:hypothetical protein